MPKNNYKRNKKNNKDEKKQKEVRKHKKQLKQWSNTVSTHLPHLSKPQAAVLALFSFGMVLVRSCSLTMVSLILSPLLNKKEDTVRNRLKEWYYDKEDKTGNKRAELDVESCFPALMKWVISRWEGKQIALALDATTLKNLFTVLAVSVVYRGSSIPVAWTTTKANDKGAWRGHWLRMLRLVKRSIPDDFTVIVMSDRGLYARWLYRRITRLGWHPFMRINPCGTFREEGKNYSCLISDVVKKPGDTWQGKVIAFKTKARELPCTLLAYWEEGYEDPWLILTDLPPEASNVCWYGMRAWIEHGFRIIKRGGWQWHRTRMEDPSRAERLWLAISVATIWLVSVGGEVDQSIPETTVVEITGVLSRKVTKSRWVSVFRLGWVSVIISILFHDSLPFGRFKPEPWLDVLRIIDIKEFQGSFREKTSP